MAKNKTEKMADILITGATGFIGSHLAEELARRGENIRIIVRDRGRLGFFEELPVELRKKAEISEADLLNKDSLVEALKGIKKVFHLAAISKPMNVAKHTYFDVNVTGTKNLLEACKEYGIKKVIHVSSMSVFGYSRDRKPLTENSPKITASDYGESKKQGEELAIEFCKQNRINLVVVRPPMVFGPRDMQFLKLFRLINTGVFPLIRKGKAKFEFCYVKNLVQGILLADKKGKNLEDYNLNDGKSYTVKEAFSEIAKAEGKNLFPISAPFWIVKVSGFLMEKTYSLFGKKAPFNSGTAEWMSKDNVMDISKAVNELGFGRLIPLEESVKETVKWYKEKGFLS